MKQNQTHKAMKKNVFLVLMFLGASNRAFAQLFCERVPAIQGNDPGNPLLDSIIIGVSIVIVLLTLFFSIKYLVKPNENNPNHIKNITRDEGF